MWGKIAVKITIFIKEKPKNIKKDSQIYKNPKNNYLGMAPQLLAWTSLTEFPNSLEA